MNVGISLVARCTESSDKHHEQYLKEAADDEDDAAPDLVNQEHGYKTANRDHTKHQGLVGEGFGTETHLDIEGGGVRIDELLTG